MEIEYYKFNKKMIKISNKFFKHPILNFLNPKFEHEMNETTPLVGKSLKEQ
jgi:hypothetical protein